MFIRKLFVEYLHEIVKFKKSYGKVCLVWFQFCKYILTISPSPKDWKDIHQIRKDGYLWELQL